MANESRPLAGLPLSIHFPARSGQVRRSQTAATNPPCSGASMTAAGFLRGVDEEWPLNRGHGLDFRSSFTFHPAGDKCDGRRPPLQCRIVAARL